MGDPVQDGSHPPRSLALAPLLAFGTIAVLLFVVMMGLLVLQPPALPPPQGIPTQTASGVNPAWAELRVPGRGSAPHLPLVRDRSDASSRGGSAPEAASKKSAPSSARPSGPGVAVFPNAGRGSKSVHGMQSNKDIEQLPEWQHLTGETCSIDFQPIAEAQLRQWPPDTKSIQEDQLQELYCMRKQVARVTLINGTVRVSAWQLTMDQHRVLQTLWLLKLTALRAASRGHPLPPLDMVLNPTDRTSDFGRGRYRGKAGAAPLFCNAKCGNDTSVSFPMMFHAQFGGARGEMSLPMYSSKYQGLVELDTEHDTWPEKANTVYFSASNTRGHRARVLNASVPGLVTLTGTAPLQEYTRHRFVVYAYGHNGWSQRLRELALFRTVVLLESSSCAEYYHSVFVPNEDYIPVREDFSDLPTQIPSLRMARTAHLEVMADRWVAKGREASLGPLCAPRSPCPPSSCCVRSQAMRLVCVLDYVEAVLRRYAQALAFTPQVRPGWQEYTLIANTSILAAAYLEPEPGSCHNFAR